jgi:hypothetical protein
MMAQRCVGATPKPQGFNRVGYARRGNPESFTRPGPLGATRAPIRPEPDEPHESQGYAWVYTIPTASRTPGHPVTQILTISIEPDAIAWSIALCKGWA